MNSFISLITIFIQKFKVAILEFILSIGVGSGRVNEMAASWLGEDYKKVVARVYVGEDELRKQLNKFTEDKNKEMDTVLQEVEKKAKLADEKQAKDEKMKEAERLAREKAIKATEENTKATKDLNTTIDKKSLTAETRVQLQRDYIGVVFGE